MIFPSLSSGLMDPTTLFRFMRDLLATAYGKPLFHHRGPTPASDLARPKMDTYVQTMERRSEATIFHNPIADGIAASLVKNAVMMVAGASDTFGPLPMAVLESPKNPQPLIRITKDFLGDLANGLLSIGAQLSFYSKYGTPGESTYAKTIVWTDLGIAAASYMTLARALAKPRMPTPQSDPPPLFIVYGPESAVVGVSDIAALPQQPISPVVVATMAAGHEPAGGTGTPTTETVQGKIPKDNEVFLRLFTECGRNVARLAKRLGVTPAAVHTHIAKMSNEIPLSLPKPRKVRTISPIRQTLSDDLLAMKYPEFGYNWMAVADALGVKMPSIYFRINRALGQPELSLLKAVVEVQRALSPTTGMHVRAALIVHQFDLKRAAGFLGMTVEDLKATGIPLTAEHRVFTPPPAARPSTLAPDRIAQLYIQHGRDLDAVASAAKVTRTVLDEAILQHLRLPDNSLRLLYEITTGMVPISDAHITCIVMLHDLDLMRAAAFLRMTPEAIIARAKAATPNSALHAMQGLRHQ